MEWKRRVHAEHGTALIETFSHERADGRLLRNLEQKLAARGVSLSPIPREEVFSILQERGRIDPFTRLLATFLQHFKGSRLSFADLDRRAGTGQGGIRARSFLAVFRPIFERYQAALSPVRGGRLSRHDRPGDRSRGGRTISQPVPDTSWSMSFRISRPPGHGC